MNTVADLGLLPVWVNPEHLIASARILLAGHRLRGLAVVEGEKLVGVLAPEQLAEARSGARVREFMAPPPPPIALTATISEAADFLTEHDLDMAPAMDGTRFCGWVTASMLLPLLRRTWDPLTGLSWSDRLREWGVDRLREGHEVTIVFIDLDDFGQYNKLYGHVVGDRVLKRIAAMLTKLVREPHDLLVRYAGDEFAIGTMRTRADAEELVRCIQRDGAGLVVGGTDHAVTFSVGIYGGRRTRERESVHYAATLDSLINLASKDAQAQKEAAKAAHRAAQEPVQLPPIAQVGSGLDSGQLMGSHGITVADVGADERSPSALTTVMLSRSGQVVTGVHSRQGIPLIESVAHAAAKALERLYPQMEFHLGEVRLVEGEDQPRTASVSGRARVGDREVPVSGACRVEHNLYFAAAEATVEAVLSALPA